MKKRYRIAIVGSGPAAIAAATALVESGHQIEMLDFGNEPEQECSELATRLRINPNCPADLHLLKNGLSSVMQKTSHSWLAQAIQSISQIFTPRTPANMNNKKIFGSEYVFRDIDTYLPLAAGNPPIPRSLARGGLSNVWGAACYPFNGDDLKDWPISAEDMAEHFAVIKKILGISEKHDLLENVYAIYGAENATIKLNPQAENLLLHWQKNQEKLEAAGFCFGQSRLAVLSSSQNGRTDCQYCGLCLYGCPYGSIYSTSHTLKDLQQYENFRYLPGCFVHSFKEFHGKVTVRVLDVRNDHFASFEYDKLLIGAGALSTVRIVCESLNENPVHVQLFDNAMLIMPLLKMRDWKPLDADVKFALSQLVLVLENHAVCNRRIQMQFYSYSDYIVDRLSPILAPLPVILESHAKKWLFNTFMMFGYLDGKYSPTVRARLVPQGRGMPAILACEYGDNTDTDLIIHELVARLKSIRHALNLYPLSFALKKGEPGLSGHISGGLSMSKDPTFLQTYTNGLLWGCKAVHIVDQSTFPACQPRIQHTRRWLTHIGLRWMLDTCVKESCSMKLQSTRLCNSNKHIHKSLGSEHEDTQVLVVDHHYGMYQRNRWISRYHRHVLKHALHIARLSAGMSILDYGCCRQVLKQMLPPHIKYTGYDVDPKFSDIQDPSEGQYDVVFAVQVLHLTDWEALEKIVLNFSEITARVVVMVPSRNAFKRYILDAILGLKKAADLTFLSEPDDVYKAMQVKFHRESFSTIPMLAEFSVWQRHDEDRDT